MKRAVICLAIMFFAFTNINGESAFAVEYYADGNYYGFSKSDVDNVVLEVLEIGSDKIAAYPDFGSVDFADGEDLVVTVNLKKGNGSFKAVKTARFDYFNYENGSIVIKNLKPNTKYTVQFDCVTTRSMLAKTVTETFWTGHKTIERRKIKRSGRTYSWKKVPKAKGYIVCCSKDRYLGKNAFGTKVYDTKGIAIITKKPRAVVKDGYMVDSVKPFTRHNGLYYFDGYDDGTGVTDSKKEILKDLQFVSEMFYK